MFVLVGGLSVASMAQKGGGDKPPVKEKPPVINPRDKPPPQNPPKGGDKPKKPGVFEAVLWVKENKIELA